MVYNINTVNTVDTVDTVDNVYTVYTIQAVLHCLNISMYVYIYCQEKLERYWSGLVQNEQNVEVDGVDTSQTVMTTTLPPCDAKKKPIFLFKHYHNPSFLAWKYK